MSDDQPRTTLRPLPAPVARQELVPVWSSPRPVPLGPLEAKVLEQVDGVRSVAEIGALVGLSPIEALHVFDRLVALVPGLALTSPGALNADLLDHGWDDPENLPTTELHLTPEQLRALEAQFQGTK